MPTKNPKVTVILTEEEKTELQAIADSENRSLSNLLATVVKQWLDSRKQNNKP